MAYKGDDITPVFKEDAHEYAIRYVSSAAAGDGPDGTTSALAGPQGAWTPAEAIAGEAAGQCVRWMDDGTYTLAAALAPTVDGTTAAGMVVWVGYQNQNGANSNGTAGNPRPLIDGDSNAIYGIDCSNVAVLRWFENFEITGCGGAAGFRLYYQSVAHNIYSHTNTGYGIHIDNAMCVALFCQTDGNANGVRCEMSSSCYGCSSVGNSSMGFWEGRLVRCVAHANLDGFYHNGIPIDLFECTADANTNDGINWNTGFPTVAVGCLFTSHAGAGDLGIEKNTQAKNGFAIHCHYHGNTATVTTNMPDVGVTTGDPDYTDAGADDFSLGSSSNAADLEIGAPFAGTNLFIDKGAIGRDEPAGGAGNSGEGTGTHRHMTVIG